MSTAREIEKAIRSLPASERDKLLHTIPDLFPELSGDAEWERIIHDERPRPSLSRFLDKTENEFRRDPGKFAELRDDDFSSHSIYLQGSKQQTARLTRYFCMTQGMPVFGWNG